MRKLALAGILMLAPLTAARADIIPTNGAISGSGPYTWAYTAQITSDQTAFSGTAPTSTPTPITQGGGAFFTLYDFAEIFGSWQKAQGTYFADKGVFDQIYKPGQ